MSRHPFAVCAAALFALSLSSAPVHAEDGVWKVGTSYVVRFEKLDLSKPADRQALLSQVERAAARACSGLRPAAKRTSCAAETVRSIKMSAEPALRASLDAAHFERDGVIQAAR
jgi:UrcA family protein